MSDDIQGNNAVAAKIPDSAKAVLQAQIDQFKAQNAGKISEAGDAPAIAATPVQTQPVVTPEPAKTPEAENKTDSLQQFRDKEGNVDPAKVEKSNEHLQKGIQDKETRLQELLKQNKELQRKFTQDSQKLSEAKQAAPVEEFKGKLTPELKQKFREELEKEPEEALLKMMELVADSKVRPFASEFQTSRQESRDLAMANELDSLIEQGHAWILTEGLGRFHQVFQQRPQLLQGATPFKDAMRFMPESASSAPAPNPAQIGKTPILGGNHAVPPPSSQVPASPEQELKVLREEMEDALASGNRQAQREIQVKMDRAQRKAYPSTWY